MRGTLAVRRVSRIGVVAGLLSPALVAEAAPNPLQIQAESEAQNSGVVNYGYGISYVDNGDWVRFANVDLGPCGFYQSFSALIATPYSGNLVHVRLDAVTGLEIATLITAATGTDWQTFSIETEPLQPVSGVHDLYLVFDGTPNLSNATQGSGNGIGNFDWIELVNNVAVTAPAGGTCDPTTVIVDRMNQLSIQMQSDLSELEQLKLQMAQQSVEQSLIEVANIMKELSNTAMNIIQNLH
jgi:hypothetical protein